MIIIARCRGCGARAQAHGFGVVGSIVPMDFTRVDDHASGCTVLDSEPFYELLNPEPALFHRPGIPGPTT